MSKIVVFLITISTVMFILFGILRYTTQMLFSLILLVILLILKILIESPGVIKKFSAYGFEIESTENNSEENSKFKKSDLKKKNHPDFKITSPKEEYANKQEVKISGSGAPPNHNILLFTWVKNQLYIQKADALSDSKGNWSDQECELRNPTARRKIYAIAVKPESLDMAKKIYNESGKSISPHELKSKLDQAGIESHISREKVLNRVQS